MKTIHVSAAILCDPPEKKSRIFAATRGSGEYRGQWEFPGGKIELGETPEEALIREIREELNIRIRILSFFRKIEYDYPGFHLSMDCFFCEIESGVPELKEATDARWFSREELDEVIWLPADRLLIDELRRVMA